MNFESLFITEKKPFKGKSERDKFLSRVFGIFSDRIVEIWCQNPKAPFSNIGRPTIFYDEEGKAYEINHENNYENNYGILCTEIRHDFLHN